MDVSQIKSDLENPFNWGIKYSDKKGDDFASHLVDNKTDIDTYESKERIDDVDRDEPVEEKHASDENDEPRAQDETSDKPASPQTSGEVAVAIAPVEKAQSTATMTTVSAETTQVAAATTSTPTSAQQNSTEGPAQTQSVANGKTDGLDNALAQLDKAASPAAKEAVSQNIAKMTGNSGEVQQASAVASSIAGNQVTSQVAQKKVGAGETTSKTASVSDTSQVVTTNTKNTNANTSNTTSPDTFKVEVDQKQSAPLNSAIDKMRQDEMAKMSEKDALSSKISELLAKSKGKVSISQSQNGTTASTSTMVSSANLMQATGSDSSSAVLTKAETAVATVTQSAAQAETPIIIPNGNLGTSLIMPTQSGDSTLGANAALTGGAVTGIDSTSSSSASQASMAGRATTQAGSPAEQVATQITTAAKDGVDKIKVQLNPAELGRVDIKLELGQDGRVIAVISADNQESLDLLKQDSKQLEQALQDAGFETADDSLSFSLNEGGQDENENGSNQLAGGSNEEIADEDLMIDPAIAGLTNTSDSGLDIQV